MSRKRFIKLMMARGWSRNVAAMLATRVSEYGSFAVMYHQFTYIPSIKESISDAWRSAGQHFAESCAQASEAFRNFAKCAVGMLNE